MKTISISMDNVWVGSGELRDGVIENCGAQFCDDNDESLKVYDAIEKAIAEGRHSLKFIDSEGESRKLTWSISEPE